MEVLQERFVRFAAAYPDLPLYRRIAEGAAADPRVASLLSSARPGQARPVLLLAALHHLVLGRPEVPAARWFPSADPAAGARVGDPWPDVRDALLAHEDEIRESIAVRSTQTNEVNRAVYLAPALAAAVEDHPEVPVALLELGASAGLLMEVDRYRVELTGAGPPLVLGPPDSRVVCRGELRGSASPPVARPRVRVRVGLDRSPVNLSDEEELRWLEACLWPDQPERLTLFRAAVEVLRADPPTLLVGDMVDDLETVGRRVMGAARSDDEPVHLVVMSSWALTYVERARRPEVVAALGRLALGGAPVTLLTAEPPGAVPGLPDPPTPGDADGEPEDVTVLGAHRWRQGAGPAASVLGLAHPHGRWLRWL